MRKIGKTARPGWFVSLLQTKNRKPEIAAPQAVCDVVAVAPPNIQAKLSTFGCFFFWQRILSTGGDGSPMRKDTFMLPFGMAFQVLELLLDDGLSPYAQWFDGLAPDIAAKVATAKYRMQQGNLSSVEWFRGIGEYKINYGAGWRIYLAKDGIEIIMLLGGGSKNGQQRDIDKAVELWKEYKQAKANLLKKTQSIVATGKRKG
jgi:putative addiction module killer protein